MIRRDFLKRFGLIATGVALADPIATAGTAMAGTAAPSSAAAEQKSDIHVKIRSPKPQTDKPITVVIIGCGNRGKMYSRYSKTFNEHIKVVGVSDILENRCNFVGDLHNVPEENRFGHYREVIEIPKMADAVIIATPYDRH